MASKNIPFAEVVELPCRHMQSYGEDYKAICITYPDGSSFCLKLPMYQYEMAERKNLLDEISFAINQGTGK